MDSDRTIVVLEESTGDLLALLVLIRTFLSWSLVVEIEHRWPWQVRTEAHVETAESYERGGEGRDA